jgi:hypothetical protein
VLEALIVVEFEVVVVVLAVEVLGGVEVVEFAFLLELPEVEGVADGHVGGREHHAHLSDVGGWVKSDVAPLFVDEVLEELFDFFSVLVELVLQLLEFLLEGGLHFDLQADFSFQFSDLVLELILCVFGGFEFLPERLVFHSELLNFLPELAQVLRVEQPVGDVLRDGS